MHIAGCYYEWIRNIFNSFRQSFCSNVRVTCITFQFDHYRFLTVCRDCQCSGNRTGTIRQNSDLCQIRKFSSVSILLCRRKCSQFIISVTADSPVIIQFCMGSIQLYFQSCQFGVSNIGNQNIMLIFIVFIQHNFTLWRTIYIKFCANYFLHKRNLIVLLLLTINNGRILHRAFWEVLYRLARLLLCSHIDSGLITVRWKERF